MSAHLRLVDEVLPAHYEGVVCPVCTDFFGFRFKPRATILPTRVYRDATGRIQVDEPVFVCAACADRGARTIL